MAKAKRSKNFYMVALRAGFILFGYFATISMADKVWIATIRRGSIFDEKSGLRSHEQGNKTDGLLTKRVASLPDLSQKDNRVL